LIITTNNLAFQLNKALEIRKQFPIEKSKDIRCCTLFQDMIVIGDWKGNIQLYHLGAYDIAQKDSLYKVVDPNEDQVTAFSMNKDFILAGTIEGFIRIWDYRGNLKWEYNTHVGIESLSINLTTIMAVSSHIFIWKHHSGEIAQGYEKYETPQVMPTETEPKEKLRRRTLVWGCLDSFSSHEQSNSGFLGYLFDNGSAARDLIYSTELELQYRPVVRQNCHGLCRKY